MCGSVIDDKQIFRSFCRGWDREARTKLHQIWGNIARAIIEARSISRPGGSKVNTVENRNVEICEIYGLDM